MDEDSRAVRRVGQTKRVPKFDQINKSVEDEIEVWFSAALAAGEHVDGTSIIEKAKSIGWRKLGFKSDDDSLFKSWLLSFKIRRGIRTKQVHFRPPLPGQQSKRKVEDSNGDKSNKQSNKKAVSTQNSSANDKSDESDDEDDEDDEDFGYLLKGHPTENFSFMQIIDLVGSETMQKFTPEELRVFNWHRANLELSCGVNLDKIGREWNEDEQFGFEGDHVLLHEGFSSLMEALAEGLDISFDTEVRGVHTWNTTMNSTDDRVGDGDDAVNDEDLVVEASSHHPRRRAATKRADLGASSELPKEYTKFDPSARRHMNMEAYMEGGVTVQTSKGDIDADVVIVTVPLGVLKSNMITFSPPLPKNKQGAIDKMGMGVLNKCAMSFAYQFWDEVDFIGRCASNHGENFLFTNIAQLDGKPVLCCMFGGDYAASIEKETDATIVADVMQSLRELYNDAPDPIDYYVSRWKSDVFARGSFCFVPPGGTGEEHKHLAEPLCDQSGNIRVQFAGEATIETHPSTIHGAYLSGIREAHRLSLTYDSAGHFVGDKFDWDEPALYQSSFPPLRRRFKPQEKRIEKQSTDEPPSLSIQTKAGRAMNMNRPASRSPTRSDRRPSLRQLEAGGTSGQKKAAAAAAVAAASAVLGGGGADDSSENTGPWHPLEDRALVRGVEIFSKRQAHIGKSMWKLIKENMGLRRSWTDMSHRYDEFAALHGGEVASVTSEANRLKKSDAPDAKMEWRAQGGQGGDAAPDPSSSASSSSSAAPVGSASKKSKSEQDGKIRETWQPPTTEDLLRGEKIEVLFKFLSGSGPNGSWVAGVVQAKYERSRVLIKFGRKENFEIVDLTKHEWRRGHRNANAEGFGF